MIKRCSQDDFTKGSIFHIYNKTMQTLKLFYKDNDYLWFLQRFGNVLNNYPATIFAYCLMPNHFHFLIRQDSEKPLYSLFNHSLSPYVRHLNYKLKRKGPIFQEKLQHIKIFNEKYLIQLALYIHNNPVKAGLVSNPIEWKYSNYRNFIMKQPDKLTSPETLEIFSEYLDEYEQMIQEYSKWVDDKKENKIFIDS